MHTYFEVLIKLLDYCEMQCVMCGQLSQDDRRTVLSLSRLERFFANETFINKRVYLWGGEPLLNPEVHEIIAFFKNKGAIVAMNTNGYKLSRHIDRLIENRLDRIIFSIDGSNEQTHDRIRGVPGSYQRLMTNISLLGSMSASTQAPRIRINFVVLPQNYMQILELIEWGRQNSIYRIHFQLPIFLTLEQLSAYAGILQTECGCTIRNYRSFISNFMGINFSLLEQVMRTVYEKHNDFACFYPYQYLTAPELHSYFASTEMIKRCRCDVLNEKLAIDSSGRFVTCPDFPDLSYGDLEKGITSPNTLRWLEKRLNTGENLPICSRCCHFVPAS